MKALNFSARSDSSIVSTGHWELDICYPVIGEERAALVDTGLGLAFCGRVKSLILKRAFPWVQIVTYGNNAGTEQVKMPQVIILNSLRHFSHIFTKRLCLIPINFICVWPLFAEKILPF